MAGPAEALEELEISVLRAVVNWKLGPANAGNRIALGMAAIEKVHLEQGGDTDAWFQLKRRMPRIMETLIAGGYLDEDSGAATAKGRAVLAR